MTRILLLIAGLLLVLTGCISSERPLLAALPAAKTLPADFVLYGSQDGEEQAWRIAANGDEYRWQLEKGESTVRLSRLVGPGIRKGFHVATVRDEEGGELLYGLVEIAREELIIYLFDAAPVARELGIEVANRRFATHFASAQDLLATFASIAAAMPPDPEGPVSLPSVEVKVARLEIFDMADRARAGEGQRRLARVLNSPKSKE